MARTSSLATFVLGLQMMLLSATAQAGGTQCNNLFLAQRSVLQAPLESAERFRDYFSALNENLVERQEVLHLIQVALIAKEHVLLMGPPGNAKSMVADMVLGGITDRVTGKSSYYRIQMTPETSMSETHGPINPKEIFESGKIVREYDQGMLFSRNVFIDEIFDARANAQRNILGLLAERQHAQGTEIVAGNIETVVGATNRYLDEVYEKAGDQGPKALLDRFSFNIYVPGEFHKASSYNRLINSSKKDRKKLPQLTFDDLEQLRLLVKDVEITEDVAQFLSLLSFRMKSQTEAMEQSELKNYRKKIQQGENPNPPYRATKYHSPRTLYKAAGILKAFIVYDWVQSGGTRSLRTNLEDIKMLKNFFVLSGPEQSFVEAMLERTSNPYERSQLSTIVEESKMFEDIYREISTETNDVIYKYALEDLENTVENSRTSVQKQEVLLNLTKIWIETRALSQQDLQSEMSGREIGYAAVARYVEQKLRQITGADFEAVVQKKVFEIEEARQKAIEEQRLAELREKEALEREAREALARQKRAELDKKIDDYLQAQGLEALKDITKSFSKTADVTLPKNMPTSEQIFFVHERTQYFKSGEDFYALLSGDFGYLIKKDGTIEKIEYDSIGDSVLRDLLKSDSAKFIEKIDEHTIVVSDHKNVAQVVSLSDLSVKRTFLLSGAAEVFLDKDKGKIWSVATGTQQMMSFDVKTGFKETYTVSNLNYYSALSLKSQIVQLGNKEFMLFVNETSYANVIWTHLELSEPNQNYSVNWNHILPNQIARSNYPFVRTNGNDYLYLPHTSGVIPMNISFHKTKDLAKIQQDKSSQLINVASPMGGGLNERRTDIYLPQNSEYIAVYDKDNGLYIFDVKSNSYINNGEALVLDNGTKKITAIHWLDNETLFVKYIDAEANAGFRVLKLKQKTRSEIENLIKSGEFRDSQENSEK
jgi:MoxR-like ATPase